MKLSGSIFAPRIVLGRAPIKKGEQVDTIQPNVVPLNKDFEIINFRVESLVAHSDMDPRADQSSFDELARDYINFANGPYEAKRVGGKSQWNPDFVESLTPKFYERLRESGLLFVRRRLDSGHPQAGQIVGTLRSIHNEYNNKWLYDEEVPVDLPVSRFLDGLAQREGSRFGITIEGAPFITPGVLLPGADHFYPELGPKHTFTEDMVSPEAFRAEIVEPSTFAMSPELTGIERAEISAALHQGYETTLENPYGSWWQRMFMQNNISYGDVAVSKRMYHPLGWRPLHEVADRYGIKAMDPRFPIREKPYVETWKDGEGVVHQTDWIPIYTNPVMFLVHHEIPALSAEKLNAKEEAWFKARMAGANDKLLIEYAGSMAFLARAIGKTREEGRVGSLTSYWGAVRELLNNHAVARVNKNTRTDSGMLHLLPPGMRNKIEDYLAAHDQHAPQMRNHFIRGMENIAKNGSFAENLDQLYGVQNILSVLNRSPHQLDEKLFSKADLLKHGLIPIMNNSHVIVRARAVEVMLRYYTPQELANVLKEGRTSLPPRPLPNFAKNAKGAVEKEFSRLSDIRNKKIKAELSSTEPKSNTVKKIFGFHHDDAEDEYYVSVEYADGRQVQMLADADGNPKLSQGSELAADVVNLGRATLPPPNELHPVEFQALYSLLDQSSKERGQTVLDTIYQIANGMTGPSANTATTWNAMGLLY